MDPEIKKITEQIIKKYKPEKIILFGSYAWGKPGLDSDLDLFIVKKTKQPILKRMEDLDRLFTRRKLPMDFLIYTPQQIKKRLSMGDFFIRDVIKKGKILYEKSY